MYIIDCHSDIPMHLVKKRRQGMKKVLNQLYYQDMKKGNVRGIVMAVFVEDEYLPEMALREAVEQIMAVKEDIIECNDNFAFCTCRKDFDAALKDNKIAVFLALEGVEPVQNSLVLLKALYDLGVRICGITWSRRNYASDGCEFTKKDTWKKSGLTTFGRELVSFASSLNMAIDITHISEEAFWEVAELVNGPIFASHSNAASVCNIRRNLTDEQIKRIALSGGFVALNGLNAIVSEDYKKVSISDYIDHIDYIKDMVGIDYIAIGLDLFKYHMQITYSSDEVMRLCGPADDVIKDYNMLNELKDELIKRKYSDKDIEKIFHKNFFELIENI